MSSIKTAKLKKVQAAGVESPDGPKRKFVKACRNRWLSHGEAVIALKTETLILCAALHYFATEMKNYTEIGILQLICTNVFLSLYIY